MKKIKASEAQIKISVILAAIIAFIIKVIKTVAVAGLYMWITKDRQIPYLLMLVVYGIQNEIDTSELALKLMIVSGQAEAETEDE